MRRRSRTSWPAIAAAVIASIGLAACGSSSDGGSSSTSTAAPATTDVSAASGTVRVGSQLTKEQFDPLVQAFEKANPKIKVQVAYTGTDTYPKLIQTQLQAGNAPDVFQADPGTGWQTPLLKFAAAGRLMDLSSQPWAADVDDQVKPLVQLDGKTYAFPPDIAPQSVLYNPDLFKQAGIDPPSTFDDLIAACKTFAAKGIVPVATAGNGIGLPATLGMELAASDVYATDPDWNDQRAADKTTFADTAGWSQVFDGVAQMKEAGCFADNAITMQIPQALVQFTSGQAAMFPAPAQAFGFLPALKPKFEANAFPFPGHTADDTRLPASPSTSWAVSAKSSNPAAALAFVNWLAEPAQQAAFAKLSGGLTPAQASSGDVPPAMAGLKPYLGTDKTVPYGNAAWPSAELIGDVAKGVQGKLTGQGSTADTLGKLDAGWSQGAS